MKAKAIADCCNCEYHATKLKQATKKLHKNPYFLLCGRCKIILHKYIYMYYYSHIEASSVGTVG